MNSKVIRSEEQQQEITYPCLMKNPDRGFIVLMSGPKCGMIVGHAIPNLYKIGYTSFTWDMDDFTPCPPETQVILSNGEIK